MKTTLLSFIIYILLSASIYSDNTIGAGSCNTQLSADGEQEFFTFLGDSLGDFVDSPAHGLVGWNAFLGSKKPDIQFYCDLNSFPELKSIDTSYKFNFEVRQRTSNGTYIPNAKSNFPSGFYLK